MSPRIKEFSVFTPVRNGLSENVHDQVRASMRHALDKPLRGPRGGRYLPFGEITEDSAAAGMGDWDRNIVTLRARRMARYVRPSGVSSGVNPPDEAKP